MTDAPLPLSIKFATAGLGGIGGWGYVFLNLFSHLNRRRRRSVRTRSDRFTQSNKIN